MKIKLFLLVGIGFVPFTLMGQTAFLYNKGVMSVKSANVNNTTLYINGDFIAGHDNATVCDITLSNSKTVLTGNFIHDLNSQNTPAYSTTFDYADGDNSQFVFRGSAAQTIKLKDGLIYGGGTAGYPQNLKGLNNIKFPTLVVQNVNHVTLVPELAAQAASLRLDTGRLILQSRRAKPDDFKTNTSNIATFQDLSTSTMLAHFMVSAGGSITAPNNIRYATTDSPTNPNIDFHNKFGAVQVDLQLDDPLGYNIGGTGGKIDERYGRSLIGMGSPYKEMLSDYFFWNFLMIPKNESVIGGTPGNTMTDPQRVLKAGEGFVIGLDLRGTNPANYTDLHGYYRAIPEPTRPKFIDRVQETYNFSRFGPFFNSSNNVRQANGWGGHTGGLHANQISSGIGDPAYQNEVLNHQDIANLTIAQGYNYYANPYTVPLDLNDIVLKRDGSAWGNVIIGNASVTDRDFADKAWILDPSSVGSGSYDILNPSGIGPGNKWVMVNAKYRVMKEVGSTTPPTNLYDAGTGDENSYILAPLQMFVLYSPNGSTSKTFKIPAKARAIASNALFLRSASTSDRLIDDFLFEINDGKTKTSDRTAIVIRTPQEVMTDSRYEGTRKLVTLISSDQTTTRTTTEVGAVTQTNMSTIYTKSDGGVALESNVLGVPQSAETESVVLYLTPSYIDQNINITAGRLETAERVKGIKLIDKVANKEFDLFGGKTYTATSKSTDPLDRFTVRFIFDTSGIEDGDNSESKSITSYYQNGTLTVTGFEDADYGSIISVYDIQGRLSAQAKVDDTSVEIRQPFSPGAYIVKVVGNKSYAAKFLVR